jgi:hypothetical protein
VNRVKEFSIDGVDYDKLPPLLLVGTNGYIAPYFWRSSELSHGFMKSIPLDGNGVRIAKTDIAAAHATGLPVENELLIRFLARHPAA